MFPGRRTFARGYVETAPPGRNTKNSIVHKFSEHKYPMKTSINWLKNYIDIPCPAKELAERLTLAGLEVEGVETIGDIPESIVVGEVLTREKHPDADRLSVCTVNDGSDDAPLQIVCGAPNCDVGNKIPVARIGTDFGGGFKIKKTKLRGVKSFGMMCSARELGLSEDHEGLLELPVDSEIGTPVNTLFDSDTVIDWEVTPNRPDWLSHIGIAREIAAISGSADDLRLPSVKFEQLTDKAEDAVTVEVLDSSLCPRYTARVIRNVEIKPSPEWMQHALTAVGIRPINNVVDITNYVLMECGQPLHAFDYERVRGQKIVVRRAQDSEKIVTLDDQEHELTTDNLLICDGEGGVALAGIMGGANSEINDKTTTVLLESAAFNASNIRATAKSLGISSESSHRFERGVGLDMVEFASRRAAALMCELAGGELLAGVVDVYPAPYEAHRVSCRPQRASALLGVPMTADDLAGYFTRLGLEVCDQSEENVTVAVPSFRLDLEREADLIEEALRLYGLANIPCPPAAAIMPDSFRNDAYAPVQTLREQLQGLGLTETMNYSFMSEAEATNGTGFAADELVKLSNPISAESAAMRPSLLPGMIRVVAHNVAHGIADLAFFEIGRVISAKADDPEERWQACIVLSGRRHPERFATELKEKFNFYDLKGVIESLLEYRGVQGMVCEKFEHPAFKPGVCAQLIAGDTTLAVLGEVVDELTENIRLEHPVFAALMNLDELQSVPTTEKKARPIPQFPSTARDISLLAPVSLEHGEIVAQITAMDEPLIESVQLFDVYEDEKALGPDRRSLAYSVVYRHPERTLTDKEVNPVQDRIRKRLADKLPVELR